ncbi:MAG: BatA domain-containing protein [Planctomycetales bacterium]|nr:BatA domain-containing protein [Planctomycetales bacterium]
MTFLEPFLLWGLPLAATPVIIHLINLRRHRKVEWGAMQFLLQATRQRKGHTRLRHFLILAMRVLAIIALVVMISRPMSGRWFGWLAGRPDTILVLLDRSASMSQQDAQSNQSKRSQALLQLSAAIQQAGMPKHLALIDSRTLQPQQLESAAELLEIPATSATDAAADLPAMLQAAWEYTEANKTGRTDVWICSDLQASDWNADSGVWKQLRSAFLERKQAVQFHLLSYDQTDRNNRAVRVVDLRRRQGPQHDQIVMTIQVTQAADGPTGKVPIGIVVDGARTVAELEVTGELAELVDHTVTIDRHREQGWGKIELPNDANPRDNVFYFRYGSAVQQRTLIVSDQPGAAWPFRLAAAPPSDTSVAAARLISSAEFALEELDRLSMIVWQAAIPSADVQRRLDTFVNGGGRLLIVPDAGSGESEYHGCRWGDWKSVDLAETLPIEHWRNDDGLLRHSDAGDPLPVNSLRIAQYRQLICDAAPVGKSAQPTTAGRQVLARLAGGEPLLVQVPTDRGAIVWLTTLPQEPYSNLAQQGIAFFAVMQRLLAEGSQRQMARQFGEIDPRQQTADSSQPIDSWPEGRFSTEQSAVAGIYENEQGLFARNRPRSEDTVGVLQNEELAELFAGLNYRVVSESLGGQRSLINEIWRAFVVLLLIALLAEAALCYPDVRPKQWVAP